MNEKAEEFGDEKLVEIITTNRRDSAELLIEKILLAANIHSGSQPQNDDITLIILKRDEAGSTQIR